MPHVADRFTHRPASRTEPDDPPSEWAPSMWVMPLTETPLRPLVRLAPSPGQVWVDEVVDLPDEAPAGLWRRLAAWVSGVCRAAG